MRRLRINVKNMFAAAMAMAIIVVGMATIAGGVEIVKWDFTTGAHGWKGNGYLQKTGGGANEGLRFKSLGIDPQFVGPAFDFPAGVELLISIKMRADAGTTAELYYDDDKGFSDKQKVRFDTVPDMQWREYQLFLPALGQGARLRLDPLPDAGRFEISYITVSGASPMAPPELEKPSPQKRCPSKREYDVQSGKLLLDNECSSWWGEYTLEVGGDAQRNMAVTYSADFIGWLNGDKPEWLSLGDANLSIDNFKDGKEKGHVVTLWRKDSEGAEWKLIRRVSASDETPGAINVTVQLSVDRDRDVIHVPWLTLFPGLGSFGGHKKQALFAGLEYLADEPSSSEADLRGDQHIRIVPDPVKITFPLMVIQNGGKYIGVIWEPSEYIAAVFDTPDRVFGSDASLIALWGPGVGAHRRENALFAYDTLKMTANQTIEVKYTIIGGEGDSIVPAVQQYMALKGKFANPPLYSGGLDEAVKMLSGGWLDSDLHGDGMWRHAVWGDSFPAQRAADAPMYMLQLANLTDDPALEERLRKSAARGLERLAETNPDTGKPFDPNFASGVGHVRFPTPALLFGRAKEFTDDYVASAQRILANDFDANGVRHYKPTPGRLDYGSTHFADHANGYSATDLYYVLDAARLSGDEELLKKALAILDRMTQMYANSEPRGAQTWEIPLHTPDILGSAYLVKCYVLAYSMTLDKKYLDQAKYWAWTGIPFVYFDSSRTGIGAYSTIAVYGATSWGSPNWIGLPVQWCGLVYASALRNLAEYDPDGPWARIASGITTVGLEMSYPLEKKSRVGLLPDSYNLKLQRRNGPDINPGTAQAHIAELFYQPHVCSDNLISSLPHCGSSKTIFVTLNPLYSFRRDSATGWFIHAPCGLSEAKGGSFTTEGFGSQPYSIMISRIAGKKFEVLVSDFASDAKAQLTKNFKYYPESKILVIDGLLGMKKIEVKPVE